MEEYEREVELIDYIEVVLKRKWLILLGTLACAAGGILSTFPSLVVYEATSLLFVAPAPSQTSGVKDTEVELPTLSINFYKSVALADEIRQVIEVRKAALIDSLGLKPAGVSLDAEVVEGTGLEFKVASEAPELPVPLSQFWVDIFMARTQGLSATESGSYYEYVAAQYDTARKNLEAVEDALAAFEQPQQVAFLQNQREAYDPMIKELQQTIVRTRVTLEAQEVELQRALEVVEALEVDGTSIYFLPIAELKLLDTQFMPELARQMIANLLTLEKLKEDRRQLVEDQGLALLKFDEQNDFVQVQKEAEELQKLVDSYRQTLLQTEGTLLIGEKNLKGIEQELKKHEPVLPGVKDTSSSRRKAGKEADYLGELNPAYLELEEKRAQEGLAYQIALVHTAEGLQDFKELEERSRKVQRRFYELQKARQELVEEQSQARIELEDQVNSQQSIYEASRQNYLANKKKIGDLRPAVLGLRQTLADQTQHLYEIEERGRSTQDSLSQLLLQRERLTREKKTFEETFTKFAKLAEEARIAREKGGTLRVITRAVTVQPKGSKPWQRTASISGAVGLLLSTFLAFFLEYVQKARARRTLPG